MKEASPIQRAFFLGEDVVRIARDLLGTVLTTEFEGHRTSGLITETEAYAGETDRASHAHGGRRTPRTEPMFARGGTAYVHLCYGMHHLFNVVTAPAGIPHAVLVRGIVPLEGMATMAMRRGRRPFSTKGPGTVAQALGISTAHTGSDLLSGPIRISDAGIRLQDDEIVRGPRIGVEYAGADARLPYRFRIAPSRLESLRDQTTAGT